LIVLAGFSRPFLFPKPQILTRFTKIHHRAFGRTLVNRKVAARVVLKKAREGLDIYRKLEYQDNG
jgi:hypothetical protein